MSRAPRSACSPAASRPRRGSAVTSRRRRRRPRSARCSRHITGGADAKTFQPMNVNFGLFPPLSPDPGRHADRKPLFARRALADLEFLARRRLDPAHAHPHRKQFLDALRDDRQILIDGERVARRHHRPALRRRGADAWPNSTTCSTTRRCIERMTFASPSSGEQVGLSFIEPRSVDDLIRRREMVKIWMDATCGMFGRSPDFLNIMLTGFAAAAPAFGRTDKRFADNIRAYHVLARERDIVHDAHAAQPAGRPLAPGRAPGKGPRRQDRARRPMPASSSTARAWSRRCAPMPTKSW